MRIQGKRMLSELVIKTRCYRSKQNETISKDTLTELVNIARISASATNSQPLKYTISSNLRINAIIFEQLEWAGYLREWEGPSEGERPASYIIMLDDTRIKNDARYDAGIALQNIRLAAMEKGIGSCVIGSVNREVLREEP
ncbi:nitroreductase family protein [Methanococcoides burtonii]|uniref:nitroreductase family protein n=1 Tax=Methanococcoides burtonii TaxID=29291 RepID=UPI00003994DF|nr:nitroreductase family protein [Methanococcoides burtonii]